MSRKTPWTKKQSLVAIAFGLAAAGLFWWKQLRKDDEPDKKPEVAAAKADAPARLKGSSTPAGGGDMETRVLVDDDPPGTLPLEGQVLGEGDAPVDKAMVWVDSNPPRHVMTEVDGSFAFDKLLAREYTVVARKGSGVAGPVTARLTDKSDPIILRLRPASSVDITVVAAHDGKPVAGAEVELRGIDISSGKTEADGVARMRGVVPGGYSAVARASGFAPQHAWLMVPDGGGAATLRLELRRGAPVVGRVVDPDGKALPGATVIYSGASSWGQQADPRRDSVTSGKDGAFRFEALPSGTFRFEATMKGFAPGFSELVTLDGSREKTGVEVRMQAGATLRGLVVSKDGKPVAGARVRVAASTDSMIGGATREAYADDGGRFEVAGLARAKHEVVALHETASSAIVPVDLATAPHEREVTLSLEVDGAIAGMVVDKSGEPIEGAQVTAWPDMARGTGRLAGWRVRGFPEALTDAGGRFALRGLEPGDYDVRALPPGVQGGFGGGAMLRDPVKAKTGAEDVRIVLLPDGGIKGKVAFADGTPPGLYTVSFGGWGGGRPFSDPDGKFEVTDLAPRTYSVTIRGAGFDTRQVADVVVKEGEVADIGTVTVKKGRTISGRVVSATGRPVSGAMVRAGRLLFGDGSSSKAAGGPPWARNAKESTTDESGEFTLYGVGRGDLSLVAEQEAAGRSTSLLVPGGSTSVSGLSLVLAPFGSLEGTVSAASKPAPQVIVTATSLTVPNAMFSVASGDDGRFRFDRLAPDGYKVSAMTGRMPMMGMGFHSRTATIRSGETAKVDLVIEEGTITLVVEIAEKNGKQLNFAYVAAVKGKMVAATSRELTAKIGALGEGYWKQAFAIRGNPVSLTELQPAGYTVCAVPYPTEVSGMGATMEYGEREGDNLAVFCKPVTVAPQPAEQKSRLEVVAPTYVPPPAE